jgi:hypothetical protein
MMMLNFCTKCGIEEVNFRTTLSSPYPFQNWHQKIPERRREGFAME